MKPWYAQWTFWCNLFTVVNLVVSILYSYNDDVLNAVYSLILALFLQLMLVKDLLIEFNKTRRAYDRPD